MLGTPLGDELGSMEGWLLGSMDIVLSMDGLSLGAELRLGGKDGTSEVLIEGL